MRIFHLSILFFIQVIVFAQINPSGISKKDIKTATYLAGYNKLEPANIYYSSLVLKEDQSIEVLWEAGKSLLSGYRPRLALVCFKKIINQDYTAYPFARFYYAKALRMSGNYLQALKECKIFQDNYFGISKDSVDQLVSLEIKRTNTALRIPDAKSHIKLKEISLIDDQSFPSYVSIIDTNEIMFGQQNLKWDGQLDTKPKWQESSKIMNVLSNEMFPPDFNRAEIFNPNYLNSSFCYSPDKRLLYFTRSLEDANNQPITQIFYSKYNQNEWSEPTRMNELVNERGYSSKDPFVYLENGNLKLLYASNVEEGNGGFDVWEADLNENGEAIKSNLLQVEINTLADEITPFYDTTLQVLYFSSNVENGYGGYDVYKCERIFENYSAPINLGKSVNSSFNEFNYCFSGNYGFLISDRSDNEKDLTYKNKLFYFIPNEFIANMYVSNPLGVLTGFKVRVIDSTGASPTLVHQQEIFDTINPDAAFHLHIKLKPNKKFIVYVESEGYDSKKFELYTPDSISNRKLNVSAFLLPIITLSIKPNKHSVSQIPLEGKLELWQLSSEEIVFKESKVLVQDSSKYNLNLTAGNIYLLKYLSSTYLNWDTLINTTKHSLPKLEEFQANMIEDIGGKEVYIDSVKFIKNVWLNKISNQSQLKKMIDHLQIYHSKVPYLTIKLNYHSENSDLENMPSEFSKFLTAFMLEKNLEYRIINGTEEAKEMKRIDITYGIKSADNGQTKD